MNRTPLKTLVAASGIFAATTFGVSAEAATSFQGNLSNLTITGTNYALVGVNWPAGSRPGCHTTNGNYLNRYAFDISTTKGRAMLEMLQAALLADKVIWLQGSTTCTNIGPVTVETLTEVLIWP